MRALMMIALSLTLTTMAYAQPLEADAQASAAALLERGRAAQATQEYERAYDLHLRALWALQAQRASLKQDTPSAQEEALVQALPHLRKQALISSGVLGWARVLGDAQRSYQDDIRLQLFDAYASMGEEKRLEHILPTLVYRRDGSMTSYKIKAAVRKMEARRHLTPSKVLHALCWGAPAACPLMLKRQAQLATASLWPPPLYIRGRGQAMPHEELHADQLKALNERGAPYDMALSASLYCQDHKAPCMDLLVKGALQAKDPVVLAQARLLNLAWVFTSTSLEERFSLMWSYHSLMKESGELEQASQWLAQVGAPLLLNSRDKLPSWQLSRVAGQLFDYGLNVQAEAVLDHLEQHYKRDRPKDERLSTYIKHGQLEAAVRLYDELHPLGSYVKRSDKFLALLVSSGAVDKLPYYIDQFKPHQERYRAYAMFAWRVATDPDKPDLKLARALMNRAQVQLTPIIRDTDYLEGKVYHLRVLGVLKEHKLALNLVLDHLKAFKATPLKEQDDQIIALAGAATESGHEAAFRLLFKLKLNLVSAQRGPIYDPHALFLGTHKLFNSLIKTGRTKEFFALIDAGSDPQHKKQLSSLGMYQLRVLAHEGVKLDPKLFTMLRKRIIATKAKGDDRSEERNTFYALSVTTKQPALAIELSQTLTKTAGGERAVALVETEALWLARTGAFEEAFKRYDQLSDKYRLLILRDQATALMDTQMPMASEIDDLIARAGSLPKPLQAQLNLRLVEVLDHAGRCEQAAKLLLSTTATNELLEQVATTCIYARQPVIALELIERIDTSQGRRARALIQVGYYLDLSGQSKLPEVQAILKRVAKAHQAP